MIRQSNNECGVDAPHVFDTTALPPHPDKRCRCGKQTWKKAEQETLAQLRCPKCAAMHYNVHASDLAKGNGEVTCSNCGHVRKLKNFPAAQLLTSPFPTAQPRTSPSETEGGPKEKSAALRRRDNQTTGDVTRHPND